MMVDMDDDEKRQTSDKKKERSSNKKNDAAADREEIVDLVNFKGLYFGGDNEKYTDEKTGAHFN